MGEPGLTLRLENTEVLVDRSPDRVGVTVTPAAKLAPDGATISAFTD
jgi:hypothetical protein